MNYWRHVLYSTAITSLSIHHIVHRNTYKDEKLRVTAQISVLEELARRLGSGERIPDEELSRLKRLVRQHSVDDEEEISWTEALLGKKDSTDAS